MEDPITKDNAQPDQPKSSIDDVLKKMEQGTVNPGAQEKDKEQLQKLKDVLSEADSSAQGKQSSVTTNNKDAQLLFKKELSFSPNVEKLKEIIKKYQIQKS